MLQAREWRCILLLVAVMQPGAGLHAQPQEAQQPDQPVEQAGGEPLGADDAGMRRKQVEDHLAAGREALRMGRIDEPRGDSARAHFLAAMGLDPGNAEAQRGLDLVQEALVGEAVEVAQDLDFELAERMLEEAAQLTDPGDRIERARAEIAEFRSDYAAGLEAKAIQAMDAGNFAAAERAMIEMIALGGVGNRVSRLRTRLEEARVYGGFTPGQVIRDRFIDGSRQTPESVVIAAGSYMMGSSPSEQDRKDNEGPRHRVIFRRGFAIGRTEVTVEQFREFVESTRYRTDAEKQGESVVYNHSSGRLTKRDGISWKMNYEGKPAEDDEPVVHVSWNDANAYVSWLARETGKPYRLPTEAEFEYALRAGSSGLYWWGEGTPGAVVENLTGEDDVSRGRRQWATFFEDYEDRYWGPAPVASFEANPFGVYDIAGNVAEWVQDCWHDTYLRAPVDGSAWVNPGCRLRAIRGGYWASTPDQARSAFRLSAQSERRDARVGIRIARDL